MAVTEGSKSEYLTLLAEYRLVTSVKKEVKAFLEGIGVCVCVFVCVCVRACVRACVCVKLPVIMCPIKVYTNWCPASFLLYLMRKNLR